MKRKIYLDSKPLPEAIENWHERLRREGLDRPLPPERINVIDSLGRVTAEAVSARVSSPFYHAAAMDGYAVRFKETFGASETTPIRLRINDQATSVDTGDPMPEGFNAVIMIEDVRIIRGKNISSHRLPLSEESQEGDDDSRSEYIEILEAVTPWQHVRTIGEDIVATELILPENHAIKPVDIGALLAGGHSEIMVRKRPKIAIIPTGNEIVEPGSPLMKGNIIEYNSRVLSSLVTEWGGEPLRFPIIRDNIDELKDAISDACSTCDMVVVNAGSSAGSEDFTARSISELGEVLIHGVGIKPGKPSILGIAKGKPVLGIPGYPVSAYVAFTLFAKPFLYAWQCLTMREPERTRAILSRQVASSLGQEEFVRVKVGVVGNKTIATPLSSGAGVIMSLVRADGMVRVPSLSEGIGAGREVDVELMRPKDEIKNTIVCIGSHDNALDVLSNLLKKRYPAYSLSSAHVGSMGGLIALKRGEAHLAGTHLLDEETGVYNIPFVRRLLPDRRIVLVNLVYRQQGLLVKKGNPKNIRGFEDLLRDEVVFINRQSGAGTRLLTDKHLRELAIEPSRVMGYEREEYTHMGVASAVLTGIADTGLAIRAAANALELDFIPVARERYDLAVPHDFMESDMIKALIEIVREDESFRNTVVGLGGYDITDMGKVMYES
ncbi:MAG TPA: molybdopterin biosynthesis protein [Nitrospiraceae bacterium]|jgi:putative molybdopterin biosynthesis protein|nr:molybdopterin biosynthesis protein [Nitrospiraceae bacterium]